MSIECLNTTQEKLDYLVNLLVSRATGDEKVSDADFRFLRGELLDDSSLIDVLPALLKTHSSIQSFWSFIKGRLGKFDERRNFINSEFQAARDYLATGILPSSASPLLATTKEFIRKGIKDYFKYHNTLTNIYGEFKLKDKNIGSGGTSEVKRFELNGHEFAIKFLHENIAKSESKAFLRFKQAHLNLIGLQSLGVVLPQLHMDVLEIAEDLTVPYVIMPVAEKTLKQRVNDQKANNEFEINEFTAVFKSLLNSIQVLHDNGVIHRDIKPENIFIYKNNLVLGDFDIAKFDSNLHIKLTETKSTDRLANYNFSAPEQVIKGGEVAEASDWYAFGQVLHWLLFDKTLRGQQKIEPCSLGKEYKIFCALINNLLSEEPVERLSSKIKIEEFLHSQEAPIKLSRELVLHEFEEIFFKYMSDLGMCGTDAREFNDPAEVHGILNFLSENVERFDLYWSQGYSDNHVRELRYLEDENLWLLWPYELKIKSVWLFKHYYNLGCSIVIIEAEAMRPTGVYPEYESMEYEEYALYNGYKFCRREYDTGWALINGVRTKLSGSEEIRVRLLKDDVFFVAPHAGPLVRNIKLIDELYTKYKKSRVLTKELIAPLINIKQYNYLSD